MSGISTTTAKRINRADLLRALQGDSVEHHDALLPVTAELCGFTAPLKRKLEVKLPSISVNDEVVSVGTPDKLVLPEPEATQTGQAQFYRVIDRKPSELLPEPVEGRRAIPEAFADVADLNPDTVQPLSVIPPEKEPLVAWAKLWPVLRRLLSEYTQTRQPDMAKLVRTVANGEWLSRIPRKQRQRWTADVQVLVDRPERTCLFNQDYNRLLADLRTLRGETGLSVLRVLRQPGGRVRFESGKQRETRDWQMPGTGSTVFILSDLGLLDESGFARRAWLKIGRQLRTAGCQPIVLMPLPQRYLTPDLVKVFDCVSWDRRSHLQAIHYAVPPATNTSPVLEQDAQATEDLLAWLSPAVRVEPALLRAVRHQLASVATGGATSADVGSEAAAWHHDDVVRSSIGFHFKPDKQVIEKYRERLKYLQAKSEYHDLAIRIAALILHYHRHVFPTQRYEELLILAAMLGDDVPASKQDIAEAEQHMRELVKAGLGEQSAAMPGIRPYLFHLEERQHNAVKQEYDFYQAVYGAKRVEQVQSLTVPDGFDMKNVLAFVDPNTQTQRDYVLFQEGQQALQLGTEQRFREGDGSGFSTGSALANFTTASGLMTRQLRKADGTLAQQILTLDDKETLSFPLEQDEVQQLDVAGQALTLERFQKPKWATAIGQNSKGLYIHTKQHGDCYWFPPDIEGDTTRSGKWLDVDGNSIWHKALLNIPFEPSNNRELRDHQKEAVKALLRSIANEEERFWFTMASGSGFTVVFIELIRILFEARWGFQSSEFGLPRILIVSDRVDVSEQYFRSFDETPYFDSTGLYRFAEARDFEKNEVFSKKVCFSTVRMMGYQREGSKVSYRFLNKDLFDLVIFDTQRYAGAVNSRNVLAEIVNYFECINIGFTSVPTSQYRDLFGDIAYDYDSLHKVNW